MTAHELAVAMPLGGWFFIDAVMDNIGHNATVGMERGLARRAQAIREAGWDVTGPLLGRIHEPGVWPPPAEVMSVPVTVSFTTEEWRFILEHLLASSRISDTIGHTTEAERGRAIAAVLQERLDETV